jgi:hypothetical protein
MNCLIALTWSDDSDTARLQSFAALVKDRAIAKAHVRGKDVPYLYMNYASP